MTLDPPEDYVPSYIEASSHGETVDVMIDGNGVILSLETAAYSLDLIRECIRDIEDGYGWGRPHTFEEHVARRPLPYFEISAVAGMLRVSIVDAVAVFMEIPEAKEFAEEFEKALADTEDFIREENWLWGVAR